MTDFHNHYTVAREDLLFTLERALSKARIHWPKRLRPGDDNPYRIVAERVVEHLELCGIRCIKKGPAPLYGTLAPWPASRQDGGADEGDAGNG